MKDSTQRFSDRVKDYSNFRPDYTDQVLEYYKEYFLLTPQWTIADIGSGTGIFSKHFLDNGNTVFAVEPNSAMKNAAEFQFGTNDRFYSIDGTAEYTGLKSRSIDFVVAAQAFHWFDPVLFINECIRICRDDAYVSLLWNERLVDIDDFHKEYEALIIEHSTDYLAIDHRKTGLTKIKEIQDIDKFEYFETDNKQTLTFEGLKGRLLSSSYVPKGEKANEMIEDLKALFSRHKDKELIDLKYKTKIFTSAIKNFK